MKKILLNLLIVLALLFIVGCNNNENGNERGESELIVNEEISIAVPMGAPYIAIGNLLGTKNIKIDGVNGVEGVKAAFTGGNYDIVIGPLNLGTNLYNAGKSKYKLEAAIALANLFIISNKSVSLNNIKDLEGKTILAYGKGGTPEAILQYVLEQNNISATIEYQNSVNDVVPFFLQGQYDYVLSSEPVISNIKINKNIDINILDLQDYTTNTIIQVALFVNPNSSKVESIETVIELIQKNIKEMNSDTSKYVDEIIKKDIYFSDLGANILNVSIPNMGLSYLDASDNKSDIEKYLEMIAYTLPNEEFYN